MHGLTELLNHYQQRYPLEVAPNKCLEFVQSQPDCLSRNCYEDGHLTASAWVVNPRHDKCLLMHHRKIGKWLQLGGHLEHCGDLLSEAIREVKEESGLAPSPLTLDIFDMDVHQVPLYREEPAHFHYDIRFLLVADELQTLQETAESNDLKWIYIEDVGNFTHEESVLRMVRKQKRFFKMGMTFDASSLP